MGRRSQDESQLLLFSVFLSHSRKFLGRLRWGGGGGVRGGGGGGGVY